MKQKLHLYKLLKSENGAALVVVLLILVVLTIMGTGLMALAAGNLKMSTGERDYQDSYYIAESGITYRLNDIQNKVDTAYSQATDQTDFFNRVNAAFQFNQFVTYNNFEASFGQQPQAQVKVEQFQSDIQISYSNDYKITSIGTIGNRSQTVTKIIHVNWKPKSVVTIPSSTVMFFYSGFTLHNAPVSGALGTNLLSGDSSIKLTGVRTNNITINYNLNTPKSLPSFPNFSVSTQPDTLPNPDTPNHISLNMTRNMSFNNLTVPAGVTLTINTGNVNRSMAVNNLVCNGVINLAGKGKLSLYVNSLSMGTGSIMNQGGTIDNLYIFCKGLGANTSLNNGIIYGSMYAKNISTFTIENSDGVQGHLITDANYKINVQGSPLTAAKMIYAPYAEVDLNTSFKGSIIANNIVSSGNDDGFSYQFVQINYDNSPFYVDNGTGSLPVKDLVTMEPTRESN